MFKPIACPNRKESEETSSAYIDTVLLILTSHCRERAWYPIGSEKSLLMDYSIMFAAEAGCREAVVVVHRDEKKVNLARVNKKHKIPVSVVSVSPDQKGTADQFLSAMWKIKGCNVIVISGDCYYNKEMFDGIAARLSRIQPFARRTNYCQLYMVGSLPTDVPNSIEKDNDTPTFPVIVHSKTGLKRKVDVFCDWRIKNNIFGIPDKFLEILEELSDKEDLAAFDCELTLPALLMRSHLNLEYLTAFDKRFCVWSDKDSRYVCPSGYGIAKNQSEKAFCEFTKFFLYLTDHNTVAVNFDAYSRCYFSHERILHFFLDKPMDTGKDPASFKLMCGATLGWKKNSYIQGAYSGEECSCKMFIDVEQCRVAWISFEGKWKEICPSEKYPMDMDVEFAGYAFIDHLRDLPSGQCSEEPLLKWDAISDKPYDMDVLFKGELKDEELMIDLDNAQRFVPEQDLDDETHKEFADVLDIPEEGQIINHTTLGKCGTFFPDGISLRLSRGWNGQFDCNKKNIYFAYSFADGKLRSSKMKNEAALKPCKTTNIKENAQTYIYKLYCVIEDGKITDRVNNYNDGTWSEYCGPFRQFHAISEDGMLIACCVVTKESDFINFIELAKGNTQECRTKAIVAELMNIYAGKADD